MAVPNKLRDELRSTILGVEEPVRVEKITFNGKAYELKCPTLAQRMAVMDALGLTFDVDRGKPNLEKIELSKVLRGQIEALYQCLYVPGTETRIFEEGDREALHERPPLALVREHGFRAISVATSQEVPPDLGKGSEATATDAPSSASPSL